MISSSHYGMKPAIANSLDEWSITTPEEQGMNSSRLDTIDLWIKEKDVYSQITSMLVIRHGTLVYEKYYNDYTLTETHQIYSITKSIISTLIGLAIEQGYINSIDDKVLDFFPGITFSNMNTNKEEMAIKHLLTMTSGLDWHEDWSNGIPDLFYQLKNSTDPLKLILDTPMEGAPGTIYNYHQASGHLLSLIIQKATGNTTLSFAQKYLFGPIGIDSSDYTWETDKQGVVFGNTGIEIAPRNLAKFGQLFLNKGTWNNNQIIPLEWHKASTKDQGNYLGYLWWIDFFPKGYYAQGYLGQILHVSTENDMVVVFTSNGSNPSNFITNIANSIITISTDTETSDAGDTSDTDVTSDTDDTIGFKPFLIGISLLTIAKIRRKSNRLKSNTNE